MADTKLHARQAEASDLDTILHHRREMFREMGFGQEPAFTRADALAREFFARALSTGHYHGWFCDDPTSGATVAGCGIILVEYHPSPRDPQSHRPWVVNVYTEHAWRRRGLARQLMDIMIEWSRRQGYPNLFLHASDEGLGLYPSLGFAATNEMRLTL